MPDRTRSDGKIVLILAALMVGGALFMLGKLWYTRSQEKAASIEEVSGLVNLRYLSPENIIDRLAKNEALHFVDIRPRPVFEASHIIDAEWLGLTEIAYYNAPAGKLVIIAYGEENTNDQLREINALYTNKGFPFAFIEGGMKNWIAQGGSVVSEGNPDSYLDKSKVIPIAPEAVEPLRNSLVRSTVIDVRTDSEFRSGHIPGAINLPLARLEKDRSVIPSIGSIFVYGADDIDGFKGAAKLFDLGFLGPRVITGGFAAWKEKGLPSETE